jgi:hypothetical protein
VGGNFDVFRFKKKEKAWFKDDNGCTVIHRSDRLSMEKYTVVLSQMAIGLLVLQPVEKE